MKVVFLVRRYLPSVGGVERHVEFVAKALRELRTDIDLTIITEQHDASLALHEVAEGVHVYRVPVTSSANTKAEIWGWLDEHFELLSSADVIHVHDVFFWLFPSLLSLNSKVCMTFHGYEPPGPPNWKQRAWHQLAELYSEKNICVGGFHQKWYGVDPSITTFGAVTVNEQRLRSKKTKTPSTKKKKLLFVGRLESDTGIWSYLESLARLQKVNAQFQVQLDVIGDGPLRTQLESYVKHSGLPVQFLGPKAVNTQLYQQYDCSLVSGYLTILESLAAGVPVISTYSTALKQDYLCDTPFAKWITVAAPGVELDEAILRSHTLAPEATAWARQQTWQKLAAQYLHVWEA